MRETTGPKVSDATLRDSLHMAGCELTPADGAAIATELAGVGVDQVEAGIVSTTARGDLDLVRTVHDAIGPARTLSVVLVRNRAQVADDLALARELGCQAVMLSIPVSPEHAQLKLGSPSRQLVLTTARRCIATAKELGFEVVYTAEDGARTDPAFLEEYAAMGAAAGADRLRLAETVSVLTPRSCGELVGRLVAAAGAMEVEMHSHDMFGLAVANAIAAADAGAAWISTTVNGIGERGGNTPLAQVLAVLRLHYGATHRDLSRLTRLSQLTADRFGIPASPTAGPTGDLSYAYEAAGQLRRPEAFEAIDPDLVGNRRHVRVRSRLKPSLLRACLPAELLADVDVDALADAIAGAASEPSTPPLGVDELAARTGELRHAFTTTTTT
jgi:homocitrate synthase NifV